MTNCFKKTCRLQENRASHTGMTKTPGATAASRDQTPNPEPHVSAPVRHRRRGTAKREGPTRVKNFFKEGDLYLNLRRQPTGSIVSWPLAQTGGGEMRGDAGGQQTPRPTPVPRGRRELRRSRDAAENCLCLTDGLCADGSTESSWDSVGPTPRPAGRQLAWRAEPGWSGCLGAEGSGRPDSASEICLFQK